MLINFENISPIKDITVDGIVPAQIGQEIILAKRPDKLQLVVDSILSNNCIHYVTDGSFSNHDLLIKLIPYFSPCELYITTYAITETPARILCDLSAENKISKLYILGDKRIRDRYPAVDQLIRANAVVKTTNIHAKVCVFKSEFKTLTIIGSSNWTTNPMIECAVADTSEDTANFHIQWINNKMNDADIFS